MILDQTRELVAKDLSQTDQFIMSRLDSKIPLIKEVIQYVLSCGGKRIRPLVLILAAKALHYQKDKHIDLAAVIELIHTATLLHDDVVDSSTLRRGNKTAHTIWGSEASVLIGDFLYSRAFQIVVDLRHQYILDLFASATHYIAEGEIMQLVNCNNPDTTQEFYFEIIQRKTAKLFEIAAELGAVIATDNPTAMHAMREYGKHLGLAYQLIDDALDYSRSADETGKNVGQDLAEGKSTLPLIYAIQQANNKEKNILRKAIESGSSKNLKTILAIIESTDAIKYTAHAARSHAETAKAALASIEHSAHRDALIALCDFVVTRTF